MGNKRVQLSNRRRRPLLVKRRIRYPVSFAGKWVCRQSNSFRMFAWIQAVPVYFFTN